MTELRPLKGGDRAARPTHNTLVLTRAVDETVTIGDGIEVTVLAAGDGRVRLGVSAPAGIPVLRRETHIALEQCVDDGPGSLEDAHAEEIDGPLQGASVEDGGYVELQAFRERRYREIKREREIERAQALDPDPQGEDRGAGKSDLHS